MIKISRTYDPPSGEAVAYSGFQGYNGTPYSAAYGCCGKPPGTPMQGFGGFGGPYGAVTLDDVWPKAMWFGLGFAACYIGLGAWLGKALK